MKRYFDNRISLRFDIEPRAKQSYRTTKTGISYQPKSVTNYAKAISLMARQQLGAGHDLLDGQIRVQIEFRFALPKSAPKHDRIEIDNGCLIHKTTKPDLDNLAKAVLDALNGIVWVDDARICSLILTKTYGKKAEVLLCAYNFPDPLIMMGDSLER
jgi:Holliday junction resolvase RusA-like endonuclease